MRPFARLALLWTALLSPGGTSVAGEGGLYVAVGYGGRRLCSTDGVEWRHDQRWSDESKDDDHVLFNVAFGLGRFIAVGGGATLGHLLSTRDGRAWRELEPVKGRVATIAFGRGRFVAGHDGELLWSGDGESFHAGGRLPWRGSVHARRSACGDTEAGFRFVLIGDLDLADEGRRASWRAATGDGERFEYSALETLPAEDVAYGGGLFVVVGPAGLIESSHDGQTWTRREVTTGLDFHRVVWTGGRFLASGEHGLWASRDGLAWAPEPQRIPCDVCWAQEEGLGLGVAWGGRLYFSRNFRTWQRVALAAGPSLEAVAFGQP